MQKTVVIIPALDPDSRLTEYCDGLLSAGIETIILIDDGSDDEHKKIFTGLSDRCLVYHHEHNMGKGRALKNAFALICEAAGATTEAGATAAGSSATAPMPALIYEGTIEPSERAKILADAECVVTADSDGQHSIEDVLQVAARTKQEGSALILGARDFDSDNVPFKSRKGNKITRRLFKILHGLDLKDTQTGLRGIPVSLLPVFMEGKGDRFEYELDMLVIAAREHIPVVEVPIETIYENANEGTHFRAVRDSISVYKILFGTFFKFLLTSLSSFVVDILVFRLMLAVFGGLGEGIRITLATAIARVISSVYNFLMNKNVVFLKEGELVRSALGYYALCVLQMLASAGLVILVHRMLPVPETYVKIIVDSCLFVISYQIQKRIVFRR